jgi:hypothetical protein
VPIAETLEQMAEVFYDRSLNYYNFIFTIEGNRILNDESKLEETERMLAFIQAVRASEFRPRKIIFSYAKQNPSILDRIINNSRTKINIINWVNIDKEDQIRKLLEEMYDESK